MNRLARDDANDGAERWPGLGEGPGAERTWRELLHASRDLLGELASDRIGLLVTKGVIDRLGPPERVGGLACQSPESFEW